MPANDSLRPHNGEGLQGAWRYATEQRENKPIDIPERRPRRDLPLQHSELVAQRQDLGFQRRPRSEQPDQTDPEQPADIDHQREISPDSRLPVSRLEFPTGTASGRDGKVDQHHPDGVVVESVRSGFSLFAGE
jgi:hypothetical protein